MQKFFKILKKILFWTFFVSLSVVTISTILVKIYEDDIEQYAITEINKHVNTNIEVRDIDLSVLSNFPYASLNFQNVLINDAYESIESDDTLLFAENLYLSFNMWDLWNENYTVKNVKVEDAKVKIKTASSGDVNYLIVKPSEDSTESNFNFKLDWLQAKNLDFEYSNIATQQFYLMNVNHADFEGDFSADEYNLKAQSDIYVKKLKSNSFALIKEKNANLDLDLKIDLIENRYTFNRGDLTIESMAFEITGEIEQKRINLKLKGKDIELDELAKTILNNSIESAEKYKGQGNVNFEAIISGELAKTEMPSIEANFAIENGILKSTENDLKLTNIYLKGKYQNKQSNRTELLEFNNVSLQLLKSTFQGSTKITNFKVPTFTGKMKGDLDLGSFNEFFKFKNIETLTGGVKFSTDYSIRFPDIEYNPSQFDLEDTKGDLKITNVVYKAVEDDITYRDINGDVLLLGNDAATKNLKVATEKSDVLVNGAIKNLIPFIEGNGNLGLVASIESDKLDINEFISKKETVEDGAKNVFEIPNQINVNVDLNVKELLWEHHSFNEVVGKFILAEQKARLPYFSLQMLGGNVKGNMALNNNKKLGNIIEGKLYFNDLDVKKLFADWNNFDQKTITDQNLSGLLSGKIDLLLLFDEYFTLIEDKIYLKSDMNIKNGTLQNMQTMKEIAEYMRTNKALKLALNKHIDEFEKKLLNLQFQDMNNRITIKDRKILIPKMLIETNALEVELSGWHDFDNNIEYHFSFRFRELKSKPEYTEFGKVEDDGLGWKIYLTMSGNIDDPSYSIDKGEMKATFKENITEEKATMKSVLKTEFGLFKKDSTVKQMQVDNKSEAFEFVIYEDDTTVTDTSSTDKKQKNKKRSNKFFDKLKEKAAEENETVDENEFD